MLLDITAKPEDALTLMFLEDSHLFGIAVSATSFELIQSEATELFEYTDNQLQNLKRNFDNEAFEV